MLFEPLAGLRGVSQDGLQPLRLLLQRVPQCGHSLIDFQRGICCRITRRSGVTRHFILKLRHPRASLLVQSSGGAILSFCERALQRFAPPRLRCFQFTHKLCLRSRLRGRERRRNLLLNLIGRRKQRLALGGCPLFVLPRCVLNRLCRGLGLLRNLRLRLLRLRLQPCCCVLAVFSCLPQCIGHAFQLLGVLVALGCAFLREPSGQFASELLQLRRQPARKFRSQGLGCRGVSRSRTLIGLVLKFFDGADGFVLDFRASGSKFLLPLLEGKPALRGDRLGSSFFRGCLDLLLGIGNEPCNLPRQLQRSIGSARGRGEHS